MFISSLKFSRNPVSQSNRFISSSIVSIIFGRKILTATGIFFSPSLISAKCDLGNQANVHVAVHISVFEHVQAYRAPGNFYKKSVGQIRPVLVEKSKNGILFGYTDNYIKTRIQGPISLENTIQNVFISEAKLGYVESEVVSIN